MVIEPCAVQFWSEIILMISNQTCAVRSFDFEIAHRISAQIALHSVQLPLYITLYLFLTFKSSIYIFCAKVTTFTVQYEGNFLSY